MKLASDARAGQVLAWGDDGLLHVLELPNTRAVGMTARDLAEGEIIDYKPGENTGDILVSVGTVHVAGEKRSRAIAALSELLKIWRSEDGSS
jgi:hypothetical protein